MKRLLSLTTLLLLLASCTTEIDQQLGASRAVASGEKTVFVASTEGTSSPETKVYADENLKVLWNAGDRISIFNMTTGKSVFAFSGEDGDTAGDFELVSETDGTDIDYVYAMYPYQDATTISTDGVLTTVLPAEQYYKNKSFGTGANTMVAVTDGNFLAFKNVGGYLSLRLYGDNVAVSRVTIKGNNGEKIAGKASITMPLGGTPAVVMDQTATDAITIVCDPPVTIGTSSNEYTDFWFVIPPTTFTGGFTITVTDKMGGVFEKSTTNSFTVSRNKLDWMKPLKVVPDYDNLFVDLGLPSGTLWATMNLGASSPEDYGDYFAWGETETKSDYSWDNYKFGIPYSFTKYTGSDYAMLEAEDDVAHACFGTDVRLPSNADWKELIDNCYAFFTADYNRYFPNDPISAEGVVVMNKALTKKIFFPASGLKGQDGPQSAGTRGYYWSSTANTLDSQLASSLFFQKGETTIKDQIEQAMLSVGYRARFFGYAVRPVKEGKPVVPNTINGHEYVDMGNGVKWATMNLGAQNPTETGCYYAWGETATKSLFSWSNYSLASIPDSETNPNENGWRYLNKYTFEDETVFIDWDNPSSSWATAWYNLQLEIYDEGFEVSYEFIGDWYEAFFECDYADDAARQNWGGTWRVPDAVDWSWLKTNCDWQWTNNYNGTFKTGMIVTSKVEGFTDHSIFLPADGYSVNNGITDLGTAGYYWSSSLDVNSRSDFATMIKFNADGMTHGSDQRYKGFCIRPVSE